MKRILSSLIRQRLRVLMALGAVAGVVVAGSLIQATHGSEAYAQPARGSSLTYRSGYSIQESGTPAGSKQNTGTNASTTKTTAGGTDAKPGTVQAAAGGQSKQAAGSAATATASKPTTAAAKAPAVPSPAPAANYKYPLHSGIKTTWFYAGEPASADNDFIQNVSSAWQENWQNYYGGSDNPGSRCGYNPCGFTPKENPFYFALPFSDYTSSGRVRDLSIVYWYAPFADGQSILKNRWIQITALDKTVYAQWEDVGPFNEHDGGYVFGSAAPASSRAGLDVSPAVRDYLGMGGSTSTSWRFVDASEVPAGPWKNTVTTSAPDWN